MAAAAHDWRAMSHFHRILDQSVKVNHLLDVLFLHPHLWDQNLLRTTFENSPHAQVSDIWLRFNELSDDPTAVMDDHESIDYSAYEEMPVFRKTVMNIFSYVGGERLGRVLITKLPPGGVITPHADSGSHAEYYDRFHLCLQAGSGTTFRCEDEQVEMKPGDLWWVNNSVEHEIINGSNIDRIHLIVDVRCKDWVESIYGA